MNFEQKNSLTFEITKDSESKLEALNGVRLWRPFSASLDLSTLKIIPSNVGERSLMRNLEEIASEQLKSIKELTDFEPGLRFALYRLVELKQLQFNYF